MDSVFNENPTRAYPVILDDETEGTLTIALTDEGIIADLLDASGEVIATFSNMADEFVELLR